MKPTRPPAIASPSPAKCAAAAPPLLLLPAAAAATAGCTRRMRQQATASPLLARCAQRGVQKAGGEEGLRLGALFAAARLVWASCAC